MKNLLLISLLIFTSCADNDIKTVRLSGQPKQRIIGRETTNYNGYGYQIIEVDGVEYVGCTTGGLCPIVKK